MHLPDNIPPQDANMWQALAFIVGYISQDITLSLYVGLGGTAIVFLLITPAWPYFNRHPVKWIPVARSHMAPQGITVDGSVVT
jgi:signal peptidase complex subunit 1